ncbi:MAG: hypothetical protein WAQ25_01295 [Candidatus Saccharimonas sp.]
MLKIHSRHLFAPRTFSTTRRMSLSAVKDDNDELLADTTADSTWTLDNEPDVRALDDFWSAVQDDLKKDPEWFNFADD